MLWTGIQLRRSHDVLFYYAVTSIAGLELLRRRCAFFNLSFNHFLFIWRRLQHFSPLHVHGQGSVCVQPVVLLYRLLLSCRLTVPGWRLELFWRWCLLFHAFYRRSSAQWGLVGLTAHIQQWTIRSLTCTILACFEIATVILPQDDDWSFFGDDVCSFHFWCCLFCNNIVRSCICRKWWARISIENLHIIWCHWLQYRYTGR